MAEYLSPDWFEQMATAARAYQSIDPTEGSVSMRETITGTPFGEVSYVMTIADGTLSLSTDADAPSDVTFSQDYGTAAALHRSELTTQEAFFAGKVRVSGRLNALLDNAELLHGIADTFSAVRDATTYADFSTQPA